ncbi:hypothetical protein ACFQ07_15460 [Actinomadura adrarensis]|uniref:Uncharacterized protein n=1 Tax=Actinomadura adrarensis TaxID=1819600 RepID=A0ABW3CGI0_9ACTN
MTTRTPVTPLEGVAPATERHEVDALVHIGETPTIPVYTSPRAAGLLLIGLAALLSADPDPGGDEPIEDSHGGVLQDLSCAMAF